MYLVPVKCSKPTIKQLSKNAWLHESLLWELLLLLRHGSAHDGEVGAHAWKPFLSAQAHYIFGWVVLTK